MLLSDAIKAFVSTKRRLSKSTHRSYHYDLARLARAFSDRAIADLSALEIETWLSTLPAAYAHNMSKRVGAFMRWAAHHDLVPKPILPKSPHRYRGHLPWSAEDIAAYRAKWAQGSRQRAIFEAALGTGLRRSDLCAALWGDFGGTAQKTGTALYLLPPPANYGPPLTPLSLGLALTDWARAAGVHGKCLHGLRKTAAQTAAAKGCTSWELMALFGWKTLRMAEVYTAHLDRAKLAATAIAKFKST